MAIGEAADQIEVHPLVDHAEVAQPRVPERRLIRRIGLFHARTAEVAGIHAAGEEVHVGPGGAPGLVQLAAAGEDEVGQPDEASLQLLEPRGRGTEPREIVHAVVDDRAGRHLLAPG